MFSCTACLRRSLRDLALEGPAIQAHPNLQLPTRRRIKHGSSSCLSSLSPYTITRSHSTYESLARGHHRRELRKALEPGAEPIPPNKRRKGVNAFTKGEIKDAMARTRNRENQLIKNSEEDRETQRKMKKEIELYSQDPLQLAINVQRKLRIPDFGAALNLTRASDGIVSNNIVSWNHLIDHCMSQSETDKAWRIFQEIKKRGHKPDAHTYTIMLRGFGQNAQKVKSGERAVGIYNSMFSPNSGVLPNTIHTNAVLNVCARSGDMDSLWAIAGRLPEKGAGSPDCWTFTTILNAIREDATRKIAALLRQGRNIDDQEATIEEQQKIIFDQALSDGRKLWADVNHRWRRADLVVDEPLVCAMGRLILGCGTNKDFAEVFDLIDQTMNTRVRGRGRKVQSMEASPQLVAPLAEEATQQDGVADVDQTSEKEHDNVNEMAVLTSTETTTSLPLSESVVYAKPSNNTLSMVLEAAQNLKVMAIGKSYWTLLTDRNGRYRVEPDAENIITYLRLLRISRSSVAAFDLLSQYWPPHIAARLYKRGTFVIAMSTCIRDKNSPLVFDTAEKLLTLMEAKLEEANLGMYNSSTDESELSFKERLQKRKERIANIDERFGEEEGQAEFQRTKEGVESLTIDPKALRMYIDLATLTTKGWSEGLSKNVDKREVFSRDPKQNNTLRALQKIHNLLPTIRRLAKIKVEEFELESLPRPKPKKLDVRFETTAMSDRAGTRVAERLEDLFDLLRTIVSAYDKVIMMAERFEDRELDPLDERLISRMRDEKRMVSGFLSRSKDVAAKAMNRNLSGLRETTNRDEDDEEDEEEAGELEEVDDQPDRPRTDKFSSQNRDSRFTGDRKITQEIKQVYADTRRDLFRMESRSRRQRNEVRRGVDQRMNRRLGKEDYGTIDEDLRIIPSQSRTQNHTSSTSEHQINAVADEYASKRRMEKRASNINAFKKTEYNNNNMGENGSYKGNTKFTPWGAASFEEMSRNQERNANKAT